MTGGGIKVEGMKWINAKEALPEPGVWVLVYVPDAVADDEYSIMEQMRFKDEPLRWAGKDVEWWMPRPGKPEVG